MLYTDQMGFVLEVPEPPKRIVSLVPSQTELLFDLGLANRVAGITKFCIHPSEKTKHTPKVGGTKNFNFPAIAALQPDLIIGNKEENYAAGITQLREKYPVWMSDISTLPEATEMIRQIAIITNTLKPAQKIINQINTNFKILNFSENIPAAYFIWREPYMSVGHDTFIHQMLNMSGFTNVFASYARYPVIEPEQLQLVQPRIILLSSEPYPFKQKHLQEFKNLCPNALIKLVDGEMFSWYGSRLQYAAAYLQQLRKKIELSL